MNETCHAIIRPIALESSPMPAPRAVLWDMDGTLEEFHWISWRQTLAKEDITITHEEFLASFGQRNDTILSRWLGDMATPERIARVADAKEKLYRHLIRADGIKALPGVEGWLRRLNREGWLQAIASSAPRPNIDVILEALNVAHCFQGVVSAEEVHRGKPDPEVYLIAASHLGASPDRFVVVEDASAGVEGARNAGMRSIGVSRDGKRLPADIVVESLELLDSDAFERLLRNPKQVSEP